LYVFSCGELGQDEQRITLDGEELDHWEWVSASRLGDYVIPRLERRLARAYEAHKADVTLYLEHGEPALP
jgi:8-oxo-dGTP diphosphatase